MTTRRGLAALGVAALAFALYHSTLLPGFDFGDTGFFQTTVGSLSLTPRDGYPLYFAIGNLVRWLTGLEPAHVLNLLSAIEGAIACGLLVLAAAELSGSTLAGIAAGALFAGSYTFWSQSIIAEVYALHMIFVALTLLLMLSWSRHPTTQRLALFFAAYALGFGNHLSMILLLPGFAAFLLITAPGGWRSMCTPGIVLLALAIACAGALQYAWNFRGLWEWPNEPHGVTDALQRFWFDVTKSDWRETLVGTLPRSMLASRVAMYRFDVTQQFGWAALLAPVGLARLVLSDWRRFVLMLLLYAVNVAFAFTYNVGDTHVFYLPSHLILAALIAPGVVFAAEGVGVAARRFSRADPDIWSLRSSLTMVSLVVLAYAGSRIYRDYPALDRSEDWRPRELLTRLTADVDDRRAILLADFNWQLVDGLAYFGKRVKPDLPYDWISHVLMYLPALVRDNQAIGREVLLTARARALVDRTYGPLVPTAPDPRVRVPTLTDSVRDLTAGTRYVLCVLKPSREFVLDEDDLERALRMLTGADPPRVSGDYRVFAGVVGRPPAVADGSDAPFRTASSIDGVPIEIRMESWLGFDTIRRMGFAQVVAARHHTLIAERGVSFAAFDLQGRAMRTFYAANLFAGQPRYLVSR